MYVCTYDSMYVRMSYVYACVCMCVCAYVIMYVYICVYLCTYIIVTGVLYCVAPN